MLFDMIRTKHPPLYFETPAHLAMFPGLQAYAKEAVLIKADNVAEYLYQGTPQENWNILTDFPCVAPPFPVMWIEWTLPTWSNAEGKIKQIPNGGSRVAALIVTQEPDYDELQKHAATLTDAEKMWELMVVAPSDDPRIKEIVEQLLALSPADRKEALTQLALPLHEKITHDFQALVETLHATPPTLRWAFNIIPFVRINQRLAFMPTDTLFGVDPQGQLQASGLFLTDGTFEPFMTRAYGEGQFRESLQPGDFFVPLLTLSFINCKNVTLVTRKRSPFTRKAHDHTPAATYREVQIDSIRTILDRTKHEPGVGTLQRALSICRGHFAEYGDAYNKGKLFGKLEGRFWISQHMRGSADAGTISKSYTVKK